MITKAIIPVAGWVDEDALYVVGAQDDAVLLGAGGCLVQERAHMRIDEGVSVSVHKECRRLGASNSLYRRDISDIVVGADLYHDPCKCQCQGLRYY